MQSGLLTEPRRGFACPGALIRGPIGKGLRCWPRTDPKRAFDRKVATPEHTAWVTVLVILISTAWLAIAAFALTMFRLAALCDRSRAAALADLIATNHLAERRGRPAESSAEQLAPAGRHLPPRRSRAAPARAIPRTRIE
jgi:hypothetical protein